MIRVLGREFNYSDSVVVLLFLYLGIVYFSFAISNIVLGLSVGIFVFGVLLRNIELHFKKDNWLLYILIISVFALTLFSVFRSENTTIGLKYLWLRLPILIIPFMLVFMEVTYKSIRTGLKLFLLLCIAAALITTYNAFIYRNENILFEPDFVFFITIIQHPYFGIFILIALISIIEFNLIKTKLLKSGTLVLFTIAIALTTSRLVYLLFILVVLMYLFKKYSNKKVIALTVLLSLFTFTFIVSNKSIVEKFQSTINFKNSPRLKLWDNSFKVMKLSDNIFFGIGIGDYYQEKKDVYFFRENISGKLGYNPHSQIVEFYLTNGVLGISVLLFCIVYAIKCVTKQNDFAIMIFLVIILFSFTECILTRQFGVQIYSVFIPLVFNQRFKKIKNNVL